MGEKHEIGNHEYLRKLSDFLQPLDGKVLPSNVDASSWIPVIPYKTDIEETDLFFIEVEFGNPYYVTNERFQILIGNNATNMQLPKGYIYELVRLDWDCQLNGFPAAGDNLWFTLRLWTENGWPLTSVNATGAPTGGQSTIPKELSLFRMQGSQPPPFLLANNLTQYRFTFPTGIYKTINGTELPYEYTPPLEIHCPEEGFGTYFDFAVDQKTSAFVAKNWNAADDIHMELLFKRRKIDNYTIGGLYGPAP